MKWFDKFKDRIKKSLVHDIPTYLDHDQLVVLKFPDGHEENGQVDIMQMYKDGWSYVINSETGDRHILTYMPNKKVTTPIGVKVYNPADESYYDIKEVEFNLHK